MQPVNPSQEAALAAAMHAQLAEANRIEQYTDAADKPSEPQKEKSVDVLKARPGEPWDVTLLDGRKIVMRKPAKPIALIVASVLGYESSNPGLELYFKAMCWVHKFEGEELPLLMNRAQFEGFHEVLGDDAIEQVVVEYMKAAMSANAAVSNDVVGK